MNEKSALNLGFLHLIDILQMMDKYYGTASETI